MPQSNRLLLLIKTVGRLRFKTAQSYLFYLLLLNVLSLELTYKLPLEYIQGEFEIPVGPIEFYDFEKLLKIVV